jgi:hypothetical protein
MPRLWRRRRSESLCDGLPGRSGGYDGFAGALVEMTASGGEAANGNNKSKSRSSACGEG